MKNIKKVLDFKSYVINEYNSVNEGALGKIGEWAKKLMNSIKEGIIKLIPGGSKKGTPVMNYFDPSQGSVQAQVQRAYAGTPFAKENPITDFEESIKESLDMDEARIPLEYTEEDQTVRNVGTKELSGMVEKLYRSKERGGRAKAIFIYGAPGIGKTQIVAKAADSLGVPLISMDLQFMAPEDFLGIPKVIDVEEPQMKDGKMVSPGRGFTRSNPPTILPLDNGINDKGGIIFLDEMNRANKMVLNSIMQFVQLGRLGEYQLPSKWIIVAAGNRPAEADVAEFDFALADRFSIVNLVPKVEEWAEWAREKGKVDPAIINFVERNEELFHYLDPDKGTLKFPTPRSWVDAAEILKDEVIEAGVASWKDLPIELVYNTFADQIGPSAAAQLKAYLQVILKVSEKDLEDIVRNPDKADMFNKTADFSSVLYGVSEMAIKKADEISKDNQPTAQDLYNILSYFSKYKQLEVLSWIYKRILEKYPFFTTTDEDVNSVIAGTPTDDAKFKVEASKLIRSGAKDKGLI